MSNKESVILTPGQKKAIMKMVNREIRERRCHISLENLFDIQSIMKTKKDAPCKN